LLQSPLENLRYGLALRGPERSDSDLFQALEHVGFKIIGQFGKCPSDFFSH